MPHDQITERPDYELMGIRERVVSIDWTLQHGGVEEVEDLAQARQAITKLCQSYVRDMKIALDRLRVAHAREEILADELARRKHSENVCKEMVENGA